MKYSIIMINYSKPEQAIYGFYSWLLQDFKEEYEVVYVYCDNKSIYNNVISNKVSNCKLIMEKLEPRPEHLHLGAMRNYAVSLSHGENLIIASVDIIRKNNILELIDRELSSELKNRCYSIGSFHVLDHTKYLTKVDKYNFANNFNNVIGKIRSDFGNKHTISYGTFIIKKEHFVKLGGYDVRLYFHEDCYLDMKASKYFKDRGLERDQLIRLEDTKLWGGAKLKGTKGKDCHMHGMEVSHMHKILSRRLLAVPLMEFTPINLDAEELKKEIYKPWSELPNYVPKDKKKKKKKK